jgi:hypothetical protein
MKEAKLSALCTGRWIDLNDHIGNRTRDLPAFSTVPQTNCATAYPKLLPQTYITRFSCVTMTYFASPSADIEPKTRIRLSYAHERLLFHDARCKSTLKPQWAYLYFATTGHEWFSLEDVPSPSMTNRVRQCKPSLHIRYATNSAALEEKCTVKAILRLVKQQTLTQ